MSFQIKRIYEPAGENDGARILVDRLWPRGISKERAALTEWDKDVAPSTELREWFGHAPERFAEFTTLYRKELDTAPEKQQAVARLRALAKGQRVTLLYAAHDPRINHAAVLQAYLERGEP